MSLVNINIHHQTEKTLWCVMTLLLEDKQSIGAMAFLSGHRLSSPRWRRVCLDFICIGFCIHCYTQPAFTESKQRRRVLPYYSSYRSIQLRGNDEVELVQCLYALFTEQAVGGSDIPEGEGVRGVCVCVLPVTCC